VASPEWRVKCPDATPPVEILYGERLKELQNFDAVCQIVFGGALWG
jgi:hypothetical protein